MHDRYRSPLDDSVFPRAKSAPSLTKVFLSHYESLLQFLDAVYYNNVQMNLKIKKILFTVLLLQSGNCSISF